MTLSYGEFLFLFFSTLLHMFQLNSSLLALDMPSVCSPVSHGNISLVLTTLHIVAHLVITEPQITWLRCESLQQRHTDCMNVNKLTTSSFVTEFVYFFSVMRKGKKKDQREKERGREKYYEQRKGSLSECMCASVTQIARSSLTSCQFTTTIESLVPPCQHAGLPGPHRHLWDQVADS